MNLKGAAELGIRGIKVCACVCVCVCVPERHRIEHETNKAQGGCKEVCVCVCVCVIRSGSLAV